MPNEPPNYKPKKIRPIGAHWGEAGPGRYPGSTTKHPRATGKPGVRRRKKR